MMRAHSLFVLLSLYLPSITTMAEDLPFDTINTVYETVDHEEFFNGVVEAVKQSTLSAQTSGRVVEIMFDVDDYVEKDDIVARLRDKDQQARYKKSKAAVAEAEARSTETNAEFARVKDVFEKKLVSKAEFDKANAAHRAAKARLESARAGLGQAEEQLEHTLVRAPYSGIVTKRFIELSETVNPGDPLMSGISLEELRVKVALPQRLINDVRTLQQARIIVDKRVIDAAKLTFFPYAHSQTNTFDVRVELPVGVDNLFPGMFVKAAFTVGQKKRLLIPGETVVYRSEVTGVYVLKPDGSVTFRQIRVGRTTRDGKIEVLAGMEEGEAVALQPVRAGIYLKEQRQQAGT